MDRPTEDLIRIWNATHPIGTPVLYWPATLDDPPVESKIRSAAWALCSGVAVAKVEGRAGGIALTHISFRTAEQAAAVEHMYDQLKETEHGRQ